MTLKIRPNAIEQDHGPFTFPGATINGDLNIDGDLNFQGAQSITTTAGDLTITPAGDLVLTALGNEVFIRPSTGVLATLYFDTDIATGPGAFGRFVFRGHNDAAQNVNYAQVTGNIGDPTDGTEDGKLFFQVMNAGTQRQFLSMIGSVGTVINEGGLAALDTRIESDNDINMVFVNSGTDRVGFRTNAPAGLVHMDQLSSTAAIPVLFLDQADISEEFIKFVGAAAAGVLTQSIVDEGDQASETREGWLKVEVDDVGNQVADASYYVPFYSLSA